MDKIIYFILLLFLFTSHLSADANKKRNILLLHSYHPEMTWVKNMDKAVDDVLELGKNNDILYTEYMDTKRHNSKEYYSLLKELYIQKYKNIHFDLILSSDNNAFDFLRKNRNNIFGDVPVVFSGVNNFKKEMLTNLHNYTGATEEFSVKDTVNLMLKLHPKAKKLYIINDYLVTGRAWERDIKKALKGYDKKIDISYNKNLTLKQLKNKVESFGEDTVVLLGVYFADKKRDYITYEKVGTYLLGASKVPVYCLLNFNISNNIVGGKVIGGYSQAKMMSKMALKILDGESAESINIAHSDTNRYIFNYNGLQLYHIDTSLLPQDSKILNKPFSIYSQYKLLVEKLIVLFFSLLVLSVAIFIYIHLKNKYKKRNIDNLIINLIRFIPIVTMPLFLGIIIWLFISNAYQHNEEMFALERTDYIDSMKQISKMDVKEFVKLINIELNLLGEKSSDNNKTKEYLLSIAHHLRYDKNHYIFIAKKDGVILEYIDKKLIGINVFDKKHPKVYAVFEKIKDKVEKDGRGFISYKWINPSSNKEELKITYVDYIPKLDWYVGSGVYLDEMNQYINNKMKKTHQISSENINTIIVISIILFILAIIVSLIMSKTINNVFKNYRKNIIDEINRAKEIEDSKKSFEKLAYTDALTKINNRRAILDILNEELISNRNELCVVMFDIDFFKNVNDKYGHDAGDYILIELAKIIKEDLRENDSIGRIGGEEFLIIFPKIKFSVVKEIVERLRKKIEHYHFEKVKDITVSFGLIEVKVGEGEKEILKRVDVLLYNSKANGRNMVSY